MQFRDSSHICKKRQFKLLIKMEKKKQKEVEVPANEANSSIRTPEEGEFTIQHNFLKNILGMHVNPNPQRNNIENDPDFLYELFKIVEKHRSSIQEVAHLNEQEEITDQLCSEIHQMASRHQAANRFNIYSELDSTQIPQEQMCKCGCKKAEGESLPLCSNEVKHFFFGPAIILFFFFIRKIGILVFIIALIYATFALVTNIRSSPEITNQCDQNAGGALDFLCEYKLMSTVRNKSSNDVLMNIQAWIGFFFCVCWIFGLRVIRNMGRLLNKKVDQYLDSSSDYVVQISNLPYENYTQKELLKYIATLWRKYKGKNSKPISIKSVQIVYKMEKPRRMIRQIIQQALKVASNLEQVEEVKQQQGEQICSEEKHIKGQIISDTKEPQPKALQLNKKQVKINTQQIPQTFSNITGSQSNKIYRIKKQNIQVYYLQKARLIQLLNQMQKFRESFIHDAQFRKQMATDMAFIEFADPHQQTEFLREIRQYRLTILGQMKEYIKEKIFPSEDSLLFKGSSIRITRAPEPSDIHWENCQKKFTYRRVFLVWFFTFAIIGVSLGVLVLIGYLRKRFPALNDISILISISLQLFNRIIWNALVSFVDLEQNNTKTDNIISVMTKSSFAAAINVILLPIITNLILKENLYGPEGLIGIVLDFQFMVFFMMINFNVINVPYQIKRICICIPFIRNHMIRTKANIIGELDTTEDIKPVLDYYEPPPFPVAAAYFYITTITYQSIFFCHLQPTLIFYLLFNIGCFYLVLKYLLIRRCKIPELFDFLIFETSFSILMYVPLFYGIGSCLFIQLIGEGDGTPYDHFHYRSIPSIFCIILWVIAMLNPRRIMNKFTKKIINCFVEDVQKEVSEGSQAEEDQKNHTITVENINGNQNNVQIEKEQLDDNKISKRRQCYYEKCGLSDLLNYQAKLMEIKDEKKLKSTKFVKVDGIQNLNKLFCEKFYINPLTNVPQEKPEKLQKCEIKRKNSKKTRKIQPLPPIVSKNINKKEKNENKADFISTVIVKSHKSKPIKEKESRIEENADMTRSYGHSRKNSNVNDNGDHRMEEQGDSGIQLKRGSKI